MARVRLVRHGRAAAGFSDDHDPGLDDVGRAQAEAMTATLAPLGPLPIVVSPLRRTLETAAPLAAAWAVDPLVESRVAEIPSPTDDLGARGAWLRSAMAGTWAQLGPEYERWRDDLVATVTALDADTVVVSHFIAINAVLGVAVGDDRVMHASIGNCSITTIDTDGTGSDGRPRLVVVEWGAEARSEVL